MDPKHEPLQIEECTWHGSDVSRNAESDTDAMTAQVKVTTASSDPPPAHTRCGARAECKGRRRALTSPDGRVLRAELADNGPLLEVISILAITEGGG